MLGEENLSLVDLLQVGILHVTGPVAPVVLSVLTDPLLGDLVEPVSVVASLLHLGNTLGQHFGQDWQERKDCRSK